MFRKQLAAWGDGVILIAALAILAIGLGSYGLYEPHEGHFAGVAREMVLRGDWITPTLNGSPYLNKPPLLYWAIAASYSLFGIHEFAARLPLAIAGWLGVVVAWKWGRDLGTPATGRIAALMLATACGWFIFVHQLLIDVFLGSLLLASYYCLWRLTGETDSRKYRIAFWLLLGAIVLTKGPSMLVFPALAVLGVVATRSPTRVFSALGLPWGVLILILVVLPWSLAVERANPGFLQYFAFNENLQRLADTRYPPDYDVSKVGGLEYIGMTWVWGIPWALTIPQAIAMLWQETQQENTRVRRSHSTALTILAMGAAAPIVLFLPISSRLVYYGLPSVPPLMLLCALWWTQSRRRGDLWGQKFAGISYAALGGLLCVAAVGIPKWLSPHFPEIVSEAVVIALAMGSGCLLGGGLLLNRRPYRSFVAIALGMVITYGAVTQGFVKFADERSSKTLIETATTQLDSTTVWTFEGSRELGAAGAMSYYRDRDGISISELFPEGFQESLNSQELPLGWVRGKPGVAYPIVFVLTDGGDNRIPPAFPGKPPDYQIDRAALQELWNRDRPVVFVTDFLRNPDDITDPLNRNLPQNAGEPLMSLGQRYLYGNAAARRMWNLPDTMDSARL
ncbi:ArnT family glycosyltransferase [Baaleninema simplex]|uniref:ArnT family glycosyltransferase n=1 Tax=Baaleninema simplex TaxID=2862350 RepID=UPI000346E854|nr:glycosyltransferase family 39 protein [Baaleninema simplex]